MNRRFTVVRDAPKKCWRIFDTSVNKFTPYKHERQVQAEAEATELNEMDAKGGVTITAEEAEEAYEWPATGEGRGSVEVEKSAHIQKMAGWQTRVLKELEGKVKCSGCDKGFYGKNIYRQAQTQTTSLKVTRFTFGGLGEDAPDSQLEVDLECVWCGHSGMFTFKNNPVAPIDIPF